MVFCCKDKGGNLPVVFLFIVYCLMTLQVTGKILSMSPVIKINAFSRLFPVHLLNNPWT